MRFESKKELREINSYNKWMKRYNTNYVRQKWYRGIKVISRSYETHQASTWEKALKGGKVDT